MEASVCDLSDSTQLEIVNKRIRLEELRIERRRLLLGRTSMVILLWILLAVVAVVALLVGDIETVDDLIGGLALLGFISTVCLI
jgi:hypothetical protein